MMENEMLNKLNVGEQLVEMQECTLHNMDVIEVTLYKCVSVLGFKKIKTYKFPFYFASKELVNGFLKFYNYFEICKDTLRWTSLNCFSLKVQGVNRKFHMVDAYKKTFYTDSENYYTYRCNSCTLDNKGIWNGDLNDTDDMYPNNMRKCYTYMELLDRCNIPVKGEKIYTFKMIENG